MAITGTDATGVQNEEVIDPRCIVKFRPGDDWVGQYGFDWFRDGDYGEKVHTGTPIFSHYNNISNNDFLVGKYVTIINGVCHQFVRGETQDPDNPNATNRQFVNVLRRGNYPFVFYKDFLKNNYSTVILKGHETDDRYLFGNSYIVPTISLFFEDGTFTQDEWGCTEAKNISLLIHASDSVEKISFMVNACQNEIEINPKFIQKPFTSNKSINIKFKKGFYLEEFKTIKAIAHHADGTNTLAGQLNVVRCTPKTVKTICFVKIEVLKDGVPISSGSSNASYIDVHKKNLRRYLAQAHVIIPEKNIRELTFPISIDNQYQDYAKEIEGLQILFKYPSRGKGNESLGQKIEKEFNKKHKQLKNALKLFLCPCNCAKGRLDTTIDRISRLSGKFLGGHAVDIPSKSCIVFNNNPNNSSDAFIPCHELLHSFGLWHSFSNKSPHTFEKYKTSNIMDYPKSLQQMSLWRWQWSVVNKSEEVDDYFFKQYWLSRPMLSKL